MKKITFIFLFLYVYNNVHSQCDLPTEFPTDPIELDEANRIIAECFAPTIHHIAENHFSNSATGRADLITSVFFDINEPNGLTTKNNWENLNLYTNGNTDAHDELDPVVYYSVVWTESDWIVTYGFYHPRDYSDMNACCPDNHENDFEGIVVDIKRSNQFVRGVGSISHFDLLLKDFESTSSNIPIHAFIDNRGHAVRSGFGDETSCIEDDLFLPCDNCIGFDEPHIIYTFANGDEPFVSTTENGDLLEGTGKYILEDIFGSHDNSLVSHRNNSEVFTADSKFATDFFLNEDTDCMDQGRASAPWGWGQMLYTESELEDFVVLRRI